MAGYISLYSLTLIIDLKSVEAWLQYAGIMELNLFHQRWYSFIAISFTFMCGLFFYILYLKLLVDIISGSILNILDSVASKEDT